MKRPIPTILTEAVVVGLAGGALALAANAISPRGLALSRNYFPAGTNQTAATPAPVPIPKPVEAAPSAVSTNIPTEAEELSARLRDKGLQEIKRLQVESLLHDPRALDGRVVFVDARDPEHYQNGHIPGAYQLDPYHPEREMGDVVPACQTAEQVVVYCTGGECEDADTTALLLRDAGVSAKKIFVYGGGFTEWQAAHLPLETGARNSGLAPAAGP